MAFKKPVRSQALFYTLFDIVGLDASIIPLAMAPTIRAPAFLLSPQKARVGASSATHVYKSPQYHDLTATQALLRLHAQAPSNLSPLLSDDEATDGEPDVEDEEDDEKELSELSSAGEDSSSECNSLFGGSNTNSRTSSVATTIVGSSDDDKGKFAGHQKQKKRVRGRLSDEFNPFRGCFDEADFDGKKTKNWEADPFYSPFPKMPSLAPINSFIRRLSISGSSDNEDKAHKAIPPLERFANIVPPTMEESIHLTPVRAPHSLFSTTYVSFRRQRFVHVNEITSLRKGVQIIRVRALSAQTSKGYGLLPGSIWVAKAVDRSTPDYQEAREMLKAEVHAYKRISEAEKKDKPGFVFLMNLEAVLGDVTRNYLILAEMRMDLRVWITYHRKDSTADSRSLMMAQTLIGLSTLHSIGITHRDLKPENIFIDWKGVVKIGDFGCGAVARAYKPLCSDDYMYQGSGGTWPYMAPEQFDQAYGYTYGISTDYWSLGIIILEVERPFFTKTAPLQCEKTYSAWLGLNDVRDYAGMNSFLSKFEVSYDARSLVLGLLLADKTMRFGFKEVVIHPYFNIEGGTTQFDHLFDHRSLGVFAGVKPPVEDPKYTEELIMNRANGTHLNWINPRGAYCPGPWRT